MSCKRFHYCAQEVNTANCFWVVDILYTRDIGVSSECIEPMGTALFQSLILSGSPNIPHGRQSCGRSASG